MSAVSTTLPPGAIRINNETLFQLTVDQYHDLIDRGMLTSDDPVELIEGVLVFKMPKNEPHIATVRRLRKAIEKNLPSDFFYDSEQPVTLADSEPEPDGVILRGTLEQYDSIKPQAKNVALIIEVSDTTLERDRGMKLRSYARAGISPYWIVNLIDRQVEIYTEPNTTVEIPAYQNSHIFKPGERVFFESGARQISLDVNDIFPVPRT